MTPLIPKLLCAYRISFKEQKFTPLICDLQETAMSGKTWIEEREKTWKIVAVNTAILKALLLRIVYYYHIISYYEFITLKYRGFSRRFYTSMRCELFLCSSRSCHKQCDIYIWDNSFTCANFSEKLRFLRQCWSKQKRINLWDYSSVEKVRK